jgi:capsular polysaccharide biosynthesis protein
MLYPEFRNMAGFLALAEPEKYGPQFHDVLAFFNLEFGRNIHAPSRPVRLDKCFVPYPSFSNRGEAFTAHADQFRELAGQYDKGWAVSDQPVYLSRSRYRGDGVRTLRQETELENVLARAGVKLIFPEEMTLKEQIKIFNCHQVYIGTWGTSFHNIMFRTGTYPAILEVLSHGLPNPNFLLIDAITKARSTYIECMFPTPEVPQVWPKIDLTIDVDRFVNYAKAAPSLSYLAFDTAVSSQDRTSLSARA